VFSGGFLVISLHFRLLSWNIDGLDERNTVDRARAVCSFIQAKLPHAVYLQEVIDQTWAEIVKTLSDTYDCYASSAAMTRPYYVAILVHKSTVVTTGSVECLDFSCSSMGRQLFQLPVRFAGVNILLLTSHLESTREPACSQARKRQLRIAFNVMKEACARDPSLSCLFGGDLNLRDKEVKSVGLPPAMADVWEACGSPPEQQYTWDVKNNDNLDWQFPQKPSCRFDRLYLLPNKGAELRVPPADVTGERFVLVGKARLSKCGGRFPSDHWGMWAEFEVQCP
jgi:tyrosyl-DNA phosphodiesterase 2